MPHDHHRWRLLGQALQALVLGVLLALAVAHVVLLAPGASVFRYEGF
jgi:hypothetical protein